MFFSGWKWFVSERKSGNLVLSGFVEGTEVVVRSEVNGKVVDIPIHEGYKVNKGDMLLKIDSEKQEIELRANRDELASLEIDLTRAENELSLFEDQVERNIGKADASLQIAIQQLSDMENGYPDEDVASAFQAMEIARESFDFAKADYERYQNLFAENVISKKEFEKVEQLYKASEREYKIRNENYEKLKRGFDVEKIEQARKNVDIAKLTFDDSIAGRKQVEIKKSNIDSMVKKVDSLKEKIALMESRLRDFTVLSPIQGIVSQKNIETGELASPGTSLVTIINPLEKWMRVYIPATALGMIKLGDELPIKFDAFEKREFIGRVSFISEEAEFTPKNVQIKEERVKQVYEVRLDIIQDAELIKAGMEGDAILKIKTEK
jgi:HlyD family secretion protein